MLYAIENTGERVHARALVSRTRQEGYPLYVAHCVLHPLDWIWLRSDDRGLFLVYKG